MYKDPPFLFCPSLRKWIPTFHLFLLDSLVSQSDLCFSLQPMKVQQDERPESPDLPEPLYEEVGDFGLQVLKSLETSFLSGSAEETHEVPGRLPLSLAPVETASQDHVMIGPNPVQTVEGSVDAQSGGGVSGDEEPERGSSDSSALQQLQFQPVARRRQQQGICTPSQELLLQELSSAFTKKTKEEEEDEEEKPYDV